ncbi:MAG TPA: hypothetical protein VFR47_28155 [Anaerolineales bacterium]|nr:hypothetical protein [Anaerolineales bacterium]
MLTTHEHLGEEFVRLALAIEQHVPGYVDSYFGPDEWMAQAKQAGKVPLQHLTERADRLARDLFQADELDSQRRDFLARQVKAMQMSLRLLSGEKVSLVEEVQGLYDVLPKWKDESNFEEAHRAWDQALPAGGTLTERIQAWNRSLEIPVGKVQEILPVIINKLRELTRQKFNLPDGENFSLEFVSDQPWGAYNWYLGGFQSRIDINTDLPTKVNTLADLVAHEGYPGHHTELSIKEAKLIRERNYYEHTLTLINSPSCVISEGIATSALETVLTEAELENWYREDILPMAGLMHIDAKRLTAMANASRKMTGLTGNAAFMLHDQQKSEDEISQYLQNYGLRTEKEVQKSIQFISNPLYRSYIFTYHIGYDLLEELFARRDREVYFRRLLEEPVTPSQVREWIQSTGDAQNL